MVRTAVIDFLDDIDGKSIPEGQDATVRFSIDGTDYEIDLRAANQAKLRKTLKPYIAAGRRVPASRPRRTRTGN